MKNTIFNIFTESAQGSFDIYNNLTQIPAQIISSIIVLIFGIILGIVAKYIFVVIIRKSRIRDLLNKIGLHAVIDKLRLKVSISNILGEILKWYIISLAIFIAANISQLTSLSELFQSIVQYIPKVLSAIIIIFFGIRFSDLAYNIFISATYLGEASLWRIIAVFGRSTLLIFTLMLALSQLGIDQKYIYASFIAFISMIALAGGLAFGLGGRDLAAKLIKEVHSQNQKK